MTSDSPSPRTEAGKRLLAHWADELALIIAKARFGPGVDMGGKHNPRPSERTAAQQFVEDFAAALQEAPAPDGLDAAIERVREYMDAAWDDGRWTYEGLARAALAAPPSPAEPPLAEPVFWHLTETSAQLQARTRAIEAAQEAPAPEGLRAALDRHQPAIRGNDDRPDIECECGDQRGAETFTDHLVRVLAAPPYPPESACTCACVGCRGHEEF